jgi:hypothetical protein
MLALAGNSDLLQIWFPFMCSWRVPKKFHDFEHGIRKIQKTLPTHVRIFRKKCSSLWDFCSPTIARSYIFKSVHRTILAFVACYFYTFSHLNTVREIWLINCTMLNLQWTACLAGRKAGTKMTRFLNCSVISAPVTVTSDEETRRAYCVSSHTTSANQRSPVSHCRRYLPEIEAKTRQYCMITTSPICAYQVWADARRAKVVLSLRRRTSLGPRKSRPLTGRLSSLPRLRAVHCVAVSFAALNKQTSKQSRQNSSVPNRIYQISAITKPKFDSHPILLFNLPSAIHSPNLI